MNRKLICISCPLGCSLEVEFDAKKILSVTGNSCKRGAEYAEKEIFHPERIVTTTVKVRGAAIDFLPVKTASSVPKQLTFKVMEAARHIEVKAPVKLGDVIIPDVAGTGVDLVATRSL